MSDHDPVIEPLGDGNGLRLLDPIESVEFSLFTDRPVDPGPVAPDAVPAPVPLDTATRVVVDELVVPQLLELHLRDSDFESLGTLLPHVDEDGAEDRLLEANLAGGTVVELSTTPMKIYAVSTGAFDVVVENQRIVLDLHEASPVIVGIRSLHRRPAATIEVTEDPEDVMAAVSHFGGALKTLSPERSFGTLRGHPPSITLGDAFSIPDRLSRPDTGIELEIPPNLDSVLQVASLAYYLGATVVPGGTPRLLTAGVEYDLGSSRTDTEGFERTVNDVLRRVFVLDCIVRTEGLYPVDLNARSELENRLSFVPDFKSLYETPLAERVAAYLSPRFDAVEEMLPGWHLVTDVSPGRDAIRMLPYIADELSLVRCGTRKQPFDFQQPPKELAAFYRGVGADGSEACGVGGALRGSGGEDRGSVESGSHAVDGGSGSLARGGGDGTVGETLFTPVETDAQCLQWVGDGYPVGATKAIPNSYDRREQREAATTEDYRISVRLVCNDPSMSDELVPHHYGSRDLLDFDIEVHEQVTASELRSLLAEPSEFLHYIGHTTPSGIECAGDTVLDVRSLDSVAVDSFFLNSCRSYEQGRALVEKGSDAGCVTLSDVDNTTATRIGHQFARLLNRGFTFRSGLAVLQDTVAFSDQYTVIGDGGLQLVQSESGTTHLVRLSSLPNENALQMSMDYYPTVRRRVGSLVSHQITEVDNHQLDLYKMGPRIFERTDARGYLRLEDVPVLYDGSFFWSRSLDVVDEGT